MTSYEPFDPAVEVYGEMILTVLESAMSRFSPEHEARAQQALAEYGLDDANADDWYPQEAWLNAFEAVGESLEPHVLDRLGEQVPDVADWPNEFETPEEGLRSINDAYERNHRNGEIGSYKFEKTSEREGQVVAHTPYPCPFDRGLIRAVARKYAPVDAFVLVEERGERCRREGAAQCTYTVTW